ncbi:MAG: hypothetical protein J7L04_01510 [Bacteroidales bacterium]|nr:hypothetical protein [Bacteroidales bacterium]
MSQSTNKISQFWQELKRRKVFRVMAMYAATAFIIMEAGDIMLPRLGLPDWTVTFIIVLLIIGFPISVILAWIFDITPEGVKKTESIELARELEEPSVTVKRRLKVSDVIIGMLVVVVGILAYPKVFRNDKATEQVKSLAVLPFKNLSGNAEQVYFVEGMHDELISDLSGIQNLKVISRTSVMRYQDTKKSIPEIARELNVDVLIEGSVLRMGDKVRINAQLINGSTDVHLWAEHYDYQIQDAMSLISKVTRDIAAEINIVLTPKEKERLTNLQAVNPEAQEYYLMGRYYYYKLSLEGALKGREYFQKAIDADTNFAKAYVDLSNCYSMFTWYGEIPRNEASVIIYRLLNKAFQLDDQLAEAHQALATWKFYHEWDFPGAKTEFNKAIKLNPNLAGNSEYPLYLASMRRFEEAIPEAKRVLRLDPFSYLSNLVMALVYSLADRNNEAMEQYQKMLELGLVDSSNFYYNMEIHNVRMGMYDKAVKATKKYMALKGDSPDLIESLQQAWEKSGPEGYWLWKLDQLKGKYDKYPLIVARIYTQLGLKDKALDYLEIAWQKRERMLYMLYANPDWIPLREEARYQALIDKMGF